MLRNVISPEELDELRRLQNEHHRATMRRAQALRNFGRESKEFFDAEKTIDAIKRRIGAITGDTSTHWMDER